MVESTCYNNPTKDGVNVGSIRLRYNRPVSIDGQSNFVIAYDNGNIVEPAPIAWQETASGRNPVSVAWVLQGNGETGFSLGDFLPGIAVVIPGSLSSAAAAMTMTKASRWTQTATSMLRAKAMPPGALRCGHAQETMMPLPPS
jgi:hypothetical protein